ncbi:MAG: DUF4922 domain-containing protein [Prevotellaceae bacterium]|jgi:hypothetical protein|nr:DUF4922 domain-containing protein [Prevotellaceae bacterium]
MSNFQTSAYQFFENQLNTWQLVRDNFEGLKLVKTKNFDFEGFSIEVCCNPVRIRSTAINVIKADYPENSCFLCKENRPSVQSSIDLGEFELLVNPYPIFPIHFTIANKKHAIQDILPYLHHYLYFATLLPAFAIFFNGTKCGASAPCHTHFQAAEKIYFPLFKDYRNSKNVFDIVEQNADFTLKYSKNYLRNVICIVSKNPIPVFEKTLCNLQQKGIPNTMINVISCFDNDEWTIFIFPRKAFRPTQFFEQDEDRRLMISPASVELSGKIITPLEAHFDKITKANIVDIYKQISG